MTPNEAEPTKDHTNDLPDTEPTLLGEVLSFAPRLASRTIAQIQASQQLLSLLNCAGNASRDAPITGPAGESHAMAEPVDVLGVLRNQVHDGFTDRSAREAGSSGTERRDASPDPHDSILDTAEALAALSENVDAPEAADLVIPGYDSLAASQVVPRLTTLSPDELGAIGSYELANRGRRTILNRVKQLLASADGES